MSSLILCVQNVLPEYCISLPNGIILNVNDLQHCHHNIWFQIFSPSADKVIYSPLGFGILYACGYTVKDLQKI